MAIQNPSSPSQDDEIRENQFQNETFDEEMEGQQEPSRQPENLNRRLFLGGALSGFAALVVAACARMRLNVPPPGSTATPTPFSFSSLLPGPRPTDVTNEIYFPLVRNQGTPTPTMTAVPTMTPMPTAEPTLTPTPSKVPTETPRPVPPTAAATPTVTPFPAGPPSKLGLFVGRNHPQIFDVLKTQAVSVVKTLELDANFAAQIKQTSPNTKIIGRIFLPQIELGSMEPIGAARAFVEKLLPTAADDRRRPHFDGWEAYNEPVPVNVEQMKRLSDFEAERTRLLRERGIRSVIGNFGVGQPPMELWEHFLPAMQVAQANDGWLGLHEYSAPTIYYLSTRADQGRYPGVAPHDSGWLTLRYRKVYNEILFPAGLAIPLVMTELGVDGLVTDRPGPQEARGWQNFQDYWRENGYGLWGPGAYVEQLAWYDEAMGHDDYVMGGCIYAMAATGGWETYDILGPVATVLIQYLEAHAP